jgi:glycosyltransferase involved in cell wall biosynthesis
MKVVAPRARNIISATDWLAARYKDANVLALPFVVDATHEKWQTAPVPVGAARRFVYAGSPGVGLFKDYVNFAVAAFAGLAGEGRAFEFHVVGLTLEQYLSSRPQDRALVARMGERIKFLGRLPHTRAIQEQRAADFAVFFRPDNRVSRVGFPTKFVEAVSCGLPVVTNRTSDLGRYLTDGRDGFMAETADFESVRTTLSKAVALPAEELATMKARVRAENPFHYEAWQTRMTRFMDGLRKQA